MSEPLGLAEMTETPVVLVEAMRAGPSTGMPTKPEQSDLEHVLYLTGRLPARRLGARDRRGGVRAVANRLPAGLRVPDPVDPPVRPEARRRAGERPEEPLRPRAEPDPREDALGGRAGRRAALGRREVPPVPARRRGRRLPAVPGQKGGGRLATGNEHDPTGHICEDADNRVAQIDRRTQKLEAIRADLDTEDTGSYAGPDDAQYGILTFGSQQGTVEEAVGRLNDDGISVKSYGVSDMLPFPTEQVEAFVESVDEVLVVEMTASGQFRGLIQKNLGRYGEKLSSLLKYNGNPFEPAEIVDGFEAAIIEGDGDASGHQTTFVPAAGD